MERTHSAATWAAVVVAVIITACKGDSSPGGGAAGAGGPWTTVDCGAVHTVAIRADGTLWAFGGNDDGQVGDGRSGDRLEPVQLGTATRWSHVSAGGYHTVALTADGVLHAWGRNTTGQLGQGTTDPKVEPVAIPTTARFVHVDAGGAHTAAIRVDGTLWLWGSNGSGQLGDPSSSGAHLEPHQLATSARWQAVSAGDSHTVALRADGTLWAWGSNDEGQLGLGSGAGYGTRQVDPVQVGTATTWASVSAGAYHTVAIRTDGTLWTWGYSDGPALVQLGAGSRWTVPAAGENDTLALRDDGTIWAWGNPGQGRLGAGPLSSIGGGSPFRVAAAGPFAAVASSSHSAAVGRDGTLWTWGSGSRGQLGLGTSGFSENRRVPTPVGRAFTVLAASANGATAIAGDGTLWRWGIDDVDQLGNPTGAGTALEPEQVGSDTRWTAISGAGFHTVGLQGDRAWGWGDDAFGQLGLGPSVWPEPALVATTATFSQVAAGWFHTVALRDDGSLWASGMGDSGQLGDGAWASHAHAPVLVRTTGAWVAVAAGGHHTLAIRDDGTLWAWGANWAGQLGDGTQVSRGAPVQIGAASDWTSLSAGALTSFGIRSDGSLWGWGYNANGQLGDGTVEVYRTAPVRIGAATGWTEVSAGGFHTLGRRGGELYAWGDNGFGQLGDGTLTSRSDPTRIGTGTSWTRVAAGHWSSYALGAGGALHVWGSNYDGQLGLGTCGKDHDRWVPTRVP